MRTAVAVLAASLTAAAVTGLPTVARANDAASDQAVYYLTTPANGDIVRGPAVDLQVYFDAATSCYSDNDAGQWTLDGQPISDPALPGGNASEGAAGIPDGNYTTDDETWDSTGTPDGPHTLGFTFTGTDCATGAAYTSSQSRSIVVNNAPMTIAFTLASGSVVHGGAAPLGVTVSDPASPVSNVDFSGPLVTRDNGTPATALDANDMPNGRYTVTATVTDEADSTGAATLIVVVANHAALSVRSVGRQLRITSSAHLVHGQRVLVQRRVGARWRTVSRVLVDSHGHGTVTRPAAGSYRIVVASATVWPGTSLTFRLR